MYQGSEYCSRSSIAATPPLALAAGMLTWEAAPSVPGDCPSGAHSESISLTGRPTRLSLFLSVRGSGDVCLSLRFLLGSPRRPLVFLDHTLKVW